MITINGLRFLKLNVRRGVNPLDAAKALIEREDDADELDF